jgi:hypothetical protein
MTALPRLARSIRFALSDLSSQNAHHEFEHLCRQLARRRIASNVIPATRPVASGGDQGRDFETFRTYLREQLPFSIGSLALAVEDTVVFACTLQENDLASKIRAGFAWRRSSRPLAIANGRSARRRNGTSTTVVL